MYAHGEERYYDRGDSCNLTPVELLPPYAEDTPFNQDWSIKAGVSLPGC